MSLEGIAVTLATDEFEAQTGSTLPLDDVQPDEAGLQRLFEDVVADAGRIDVAAEHFAIARFVAGKVPFERVRAVRDAVPRHPFLRLLPALRQYSRHLYHSGIIIIHYFCLKTAQFRPAKPNIKILS